MTCARPWQSLLLAFNLLVVGSPAWADEGGNAPGGSNAAPPSKRSPNPITKTIPGKPVIDQSSSTAPVAEAAPSPRTPATDDDSSAAEPESAPEAPKPEPPNPETTDPGAEPPVSVAVLDLRAPAAQQPLAEAAAALVTTAIDAEARFSAQAGDAVQQALARLPEDERSAVACETQVDCIGAIAAAVGTRYVVFGAVEMVPKRDAASDASATEDNVAVVVLSAYGARSATVLRVERVRVASLDALKARLPAAVTTLVTAMAAAEWPTPEAAVAAAPASERDAGPAAAASGERAATGAGDAMAPADSAASAAPTTAEPPSSTESASTNGAAAPTDSRTSTSPAAPEAPPIAAAPGATDSPGEDEDAEGMSIPALAVAGTGGAVFVGGLALTVVGAIPLVLGTLATAQVAQLEQEALASPDGIASADNLRASAALQESIAANGDAWTGWGQYVLYAGLAASAVGVLTTGVGATWAIISGLSGDAPAGDGASE